MRNIYIIIALLLAFATVKGQNDNKLTGNIIGSKYSVNYDTGGSSTTVNTKAAAFDGNPDTFFASFDRSLSWVGLDLGTPHIITRVGWAARKHDVGPRRVRLAVFEGANMEDFSDAIPLYMIPDDTGQGVLCHADVNVTRAFRYVRYVGPNSARCNIAEVEFYGHEGEGDDSQLYQPTNLPLVVMHSEGNREPVDKVNDINAQVKIIYNNGKHIQDHDGTIRLRGNASMGFEKKPYRIKYNKKHYVLKDSEDESPAKEKKWTLINNYGDKTLMRNMIAFEASRRIGMDYTPFCKPVDVMLNGEYKGCYQLCDQIEVGPDRVNVTEMTIEDVNGVPLTGGYFVEIDAYAHDEPVWFNSSKGNPVTIKYPDEEEITNQQIDYIHNYFNAMETRLFTSNYTNKTNGYRSRLDLESFLKHFIVGEFCGNTDTYWSTYLWKERGDELFHVGPVWDFDLAFENDNRTYPINNLNDYIYKTKGSQAGNMRTFVNRILSDPDAVTMLQQLWADARDEGRYTPAAFLNFVDRSAIELDASQQLNFKRWNMLNSWVHQNPQVAGSYQGEVNVVRNYIKQRFNWFDKKLKYTPKTAENQEVLSISTPADLMLFAQRVQNGETKLAAVLCNDINMDGWGSRFSPIGNMYNRYEGTFDGQRHTIRNLNIEGDDYTGLFGVVAGGAVVRNVTLDNSCSISGKSYVGMIGATYGEGNVFIQNCGNEADITAQGINAGGILGVNMESKTSIDISNCYNAGHISGNTECGAISGWLGNDASVSNTYNCGEVDGISSMAEHMARGNGILFTKCYDTEGLQVENITYEQMVSGELCYTLSNETSRPDLTPWRQTLEEDEHPMLTDSHDIVDYDGNEYTNIKVGIIITEYDKGAYPVSAYDINGVRLQQLHKGINILRMNNGQVIKLKR